MTRLKTTMLSMALAMTALAQEAPVTERIYLSGTGCDDMKEWDFFCTDGQNAGKWSKIGVPSCWELQGFGNYQYGMRFYGKAFPEGIAQEKGMYKYEFNLPEDWKGKKIDLVFEASMTDTKVTINGRKGGEHQGGFYRFSFDVSDRIFFGDQKNKLEVTVSKESTNASVNLAERRADYWNFGGIYRPVFAVAKPAFNIARKSVHALADGTFQANVYTNIAAEGMTVHTVVFDAKGKKVSEKKSDIRSGSDRVNVAMKVAKPQLWSAETPNLYTAEFTLIDKSGKPMHKESQKFGFRTVEVRESDGLYINGVRVNVRGVNRHSFRPESGRTLSKAKNIEDVLLIKGMNMNSVRLSHYPADPEFLQACDSLGLYVMNELGGWHGKYETAIGQKLIEGMIIRDENHPSVIWWSNGNEQGWNTELDGEFHKWDMQRRPVIHPQGNFGGFETMHYRSYGESQNYMRKPEIFMPTEFLHGLYDGGHGAGLDDYWKMMRKHPRCIGGFLWVLADEGVKRVDMDGFIDNQGNFGADGIVGPNHEKEGSYYTIKQIWCPVQIMNEQIDSKFDGKLEIENRYDFLNLNTVTFEWSQVKYPSVNSNASVKVLKKGTQKGADVKPHESGVVSLPKMDPDADALIVKAVDKYGDELFAWTYVVKKTTPVAENVAGNAPAHMETIQAVKVEANGRTYEFDKKDGLLKSVVVNGRTIHFSNGPRFIGARRADRSLDQFYNHDDLDAQKKNRTYTEFPEAAVFTGFEVKKAGNNLVVVANYRLGNMGQARWTIRPDGSALLDYTYNFSGVVDLMGIMFDYPESKVIRKSWLGDGPYRVWQNRLHGPQYGIWENDYNDPIPGESFLYPEFKGYFANVNWMEIKTQEGTIQIMNQTPDSYVGVYQPRDGRDKILYTLPESGISILNVIPAVRNKVNATDLCGPSSQPKWVDGEYTGRLLFCFE